MKKIADVTAVVLAGGRSGRMGFDKALHRWGETTLTERVVATLADVFAEVLVARGSREAAFDRRLRLIPDLLPGGGAIVGIHAGLSAAATPRIFAVACDAPFPEPALVRLLVEYDRDAAWTCPRVGENLEPLFAVYDKACLPHLERMALDDDRRIRRLADLVPTAFVDEPLLRAHDPELRSFLNVNRPEDLLLLGDD